MRADAKKIGGRAIRRAAAERTVEEAAVAQRAALSSMLMGKSPDLNRAVDALIARQARELPPVEAAIGSS